MREYRLWASASFVAIVALFIASIFIVSMQPLESTDSSITGFVTTSASSLPPPPGAPNLIFCTSSSPSVSVEQGSSASVALSELFSGDTSSHSFSASAPSGLAVNISSSSVHVTNNNFQGSDVVEVTGTNSGDSVTCDFNVSGTLADEEEEPEPQPPGDVSVADAVQRSISVGAFSDWSGINSYESSEIHPSHEGRALPSAWSSSFRVAWDEDALYLLYEIDKDSIETGLDTFSHNDGVEILIGGSNSKSDSFQADDHQLQVRADGHVRQGLRYNDGAPDNPDGVVVETQTTSSGYELEVSISWDFIGGSAPDEGVVYGFTTSTIFYNPDGAEDEKSVMMFWNYATSHFRETLEWSELELVGSAARGDDDSSGDDSGSDDSGDDSSSGGSSGGSTGGSSGGSTGGGAAVGGGGFGFVPREERPSSGEEDVCDDDYVCGDWKPCSVDGDQTRTCVDRNECAEERVDRRECQQVIRFQVEGSEETLQLTRESRGYSLEQGLAVGTRFTTDEDLGPNATVRMGGQEYLLVRDGRLTYVLTEAPQKSVPQRISESVPEDDSRPAYWIWILVVGGIMGGAVAVLTRIHTEVTHPQPKNALEQWLLDNKDASDEQLFSALVNRGYDESKAREDIQQMRSEL